MIREDEEALICDLAETYHIYDYKKLPLTQVAIFANGLRNESRIKERLSGDIADEMNTDTLLLAGIFDKLSFLLWSKTVDAQKGTNRPKMIMSALFPRLASKSNQNDNTNGDVIVFNTGEDFEKRRNEILNAGGD